MTRAERRAAREASRRRDQQGVFARARRLRVDARQETAPVGSEARQHASHALARATGDVLAMPGYRWQKSGAHIDTACECPDARGQSWLRDPPASGFLALVACERRS